ncbi:MAG: indolepyruvate oxidoreductase subunit beta [Acidobacteria bacterium]|nr:indolepyruvate oxidoreductase subunit beta [Acidobacteriota bacterium]MBP8274542.1 indolepyruvate oxidoreductase subunit beta [Acidobacteriota bacterium]
MKFDIILAGVGGQGVLSLAGIIASAALDDGLSVKQSEIHGMSQRGGAVFAHLRLADAPIASDLVALGSASMVLCMEPLESMRYLEYLSPTGTVITATEPVSNMRNYPPIDEVLAAIRRLPHAIPVDAAGLAKRAGLAQATNCVLAGAAAPLLPIQAGTLERGIRQRFQRKGQEIVDQNLAAFRAGQEAATCAIQ